MHAWMLEVRVDDKPWWILGVYRTKKAAHDGLRAGGLLMRTGAHLSCDGRIRKWVREKGGA